MQPHVKPKLILVSLDTETTSLAHTEGVMWQCGLAAALIHSDGSQMQLPTSLSEINFPAKWTNPESFKWTMGTLSGRLRSEVDSWQSMSEEDIAIARGRAAAQLKVQLIALQTNAYYQAVPIVVVMRHPDFDVPFVEQEVPLRSIVGYRSIFDLTSILAGYFGASGLPTAGDAFKSTNRGRGKTAHTAMKDAEDQLAILRSINWAGLHKIADGLPLPPKIKTADPQQS